MTPDADDAALRILFVEDNPYDAELAEQTLRREGLRFASRRLDSEEAFVDALASFRPDVIVSDYSMPSFDGMRALRIALGTHTDVPFILLTGSLNEETAVACMKAGATDYVLKGSIARLPFAVREAIEQRKERAARGAAESALRMSEERFSTVFRASPVSSTITRLDNDAIVDANEAFFAMSGYLRAEVVGRTADALALWASPDERAQAMDALVQHDGSVRDFETRFRRKSGEIRDVLLSFERIVVAGEPYALMLTQDITDRKRMERELVEEKERAERSDRLKDAFIANISHEIRTPLNIILGYTTLIGDLVADKTTDDERSYFESVQRGAQRLLRTVDMILNIARLQTGVFDLNRQRISLQSLVQGVVLDYRSAAQSKALDLVYTNELEETTVYVDEYCITQALQNLVDNALKFTHAGSVSVTIFRNDHGAPSIDIRDTGVGISQEYLPHIFEPYSQEEIGHSRTYDGIGLGLALVKRYAELNDATVEVTSAKGKGTIFTITFTPDRYIEELREAGGGDADAPAAEPTRAKKRLRGGTPVRSALIVEDDPLTIEYMQTILRERYLTFAADSAASAWEILRERPVDIVLMDISLKGMKTGLELTREIRASAPHAHIPVIAVTAHAFVADRIQCLEAGCNEYIKKPMSRVKLLDVMDRLLDV